MRVKELLGKEALDVNAKVIGRVIDIDFDIKQATMRLFRNDLFPM